MGIELDRVWEMPVTKKLAYGQHLDARDKFDNYIQQVVQARQHEEMDFDPEQLGGGAPDIDIPSGMGNMNMPDMPSQMSSPMSSGGGGDADMHPALRKYASSSTGRVVNVVGEEGDGDGGAGDSGDE